MINFIFSPSTGNAIFTVCNAKNTYIILFLALVGDILYRDIKRYENWSEKVIKFRTCPQNKMLVESHAEALIGT